MTQALKNSKGAKTLAVFFVLLNVEEFYFEDKC